MVFLVNIAILDVIVRKICLRCMYGRNKTITQDSSLMGRSE